MYRTIIRKQLCGINLWSSSSTTLLSHSPNTPSAKASSRLIQLSAITFLIELESKHAHSSSSTYQSLLWPFSLAKRTTLASPYRAATGHVVDHSRIGWHLSAWTYCINNPFHLVSNAWYVLFIHQNYAINSEYGAVKTASARAAARIHPVMT